LSLFEQELAKYCSDLCTVTEDIVESILVPFPWTLYILLCSCNSTC